MRKGEVVPSRVLSSTDRKQPILRYRGVSLCPTLQRRRCNACHGARYAQPGDIHKTGSTCATYRNADRKSPSHSIGNVHKNLRKIGADRQTDRQADRHAHSNTLPPIHRGGRVKTTVKQNVHSLKRHRTADMLFQLIVDLQDDS